MAQADQQVQDAFFPAVRADINDNLAALFSQSSGVSAPTVTQAYQPWIDTSSSPAVWKIRNGADTGWITVGTIDATTFAFGGLVPIASGGTGATTAAAALAALLPSQSGNAGKGLITDGSLASWGTIAAGVSAQIFSSTGSGTYTPTAGKTTALVIVTGGGGGGARPSTTGSYTTGGGGGTGFRVYSQSELGASAAVTVGSGGAASFGGTGGTGGTSSFDPAGSGLTLSGLGGTGGVGGTSNGSGGLATNAQFFATGMVPHSFWGGNYGSSGYYTAGLAGVVIILEF